MTVSNSSYTDLLIKFQPRPITSQATLERTYKLIDRLMDKSALSRGESEMLHMLSLLVEQYESREHPTPKVPAATLLKHLIESRGISKSALATATRIPRSTITEILSGARRISIANVTKLAAFFDLPASVFISNDSDQQKNRLNVTN